MAAKAKLALVQRDAESITKEFDDLFMRTNKRQPRPEDVVELRRMLGEHSKMKLWNRAAGAMESAEWFLLQRRAPSEALSFMWRAGVRETKESLGHGSASPLESMLIDHAVLCWLRLAIIEMEYTLNLSDQPSLTLGIYYEKRLTAAQKRFTRACESLARVRKLIGASGARPGATDAQPRDMRAW